MPKISNGYLQRKKSILHLNSNLSKVKEEAEKKTVYVGGQQVVLKSVVFETEEVKKSDKGKKGQEHCVGINSVADNVVA